MEPLTEVQWKEVPNLGGGDTANTDYSAYKHIEDQGMLLIYTIRLEGKLSGYAVFSLIPSMQMSGSVHAKNITLYLSPELRGGTVSAAFIQAIEEDLKFDEGVDRVDYQFKPHKVPNTLMGVLGYVQSEVTFSKVLGE